ncbi:pyruvate kinase [Thermobifida cellulosilytica]|mgnify:FL=1|uniref:Pyruvate kinase n=1 Tax=Thermobifida cellulosilytica TB100 TaxID=665004 RepID=A0A147KMR6_THECS|nr:pyruvate kinase [Thermobifida cellulosilytica]KUP98538.1 pyruvate kinase [Thermobifida cellulosilytica TB100]
MTRRAKIVATLGPATSSPETLRRLVDAGLDVARLNLSHGTHADHSANYANVRAAAEASGRSVGILADLQGPKIRLGTFADGPVTLNPGDEFTITVDDVPGDRHRVSTTYKGLPGDVRPGDRVLIDDGRVVLECVKSSSTDVHTRVIIGGQVSDHKGLNLPGVAVAVPALTEKDERDLRWALEQGVDLVALSFVRSPADAEDVHRVMDEVGVRVPLIAKIEKPQAVERLQDIIEAFDGVMVARGDLGVELPLENVPMVQKRAIERCRDKAKPVIVATQMLESMINAPRPTRAEASDVANAVLDGADAVMLSGETSVGKYPVETVQTMARIIAAAEQESLRASHILNRVPETVGGSIARAAAEVGATVGAKALVAFTSSGETARRLARYRSPIPLLAFTTESSTRAQLSLTWGVDTHLVPWVDNTDDMVRQVETELLDMGYQKGDKVVIVAGSPPGTQGSTNMLRVHRMGDAITNR